MEGKLTLTGRLKAKRIHSPGPGVVWWLKNWLRWHQIKSLIGVFVARPIANLFGVATMHGKLEAVLIHADGSKVRYGVLSYRMITTAFVNLMVDQLQTETSVWGDFKYHDAGIGTTAAATTDTDIETTDGESRATGSQEEGGTANVYKSIGTVSYTTSKAVTEHGLFNASTGVTLMDRHVFTAINVVSGDSIQFTYQLTCTAGG